MSVGKKILIVEDESAMLEALARKFGNEGFECLKAGNGADGLAMALKEKPDLVMLDIIMPKLDGLATARGIREHQKWGSDVPIIMLTNLSDTATVAEAAKYRVYDFLVKTDWRLDDIVKLVKTKLSL